MKMDLKGIGCGEAILIPELTQYRVEW